MARSDDSPPWLQTLRDQVQRERADDVLLERFARGEVVKELEGRIAEDAELRDVVASLRPVDAAQLERWADRVAPKRGSVRWIKFARVAGPLSLAASIGLFLAFGSSSEHDPLPEYALVAHGEARLRGQVEPGCDVCLRVGQGGGRFEIVARPAVRVDGPIVAFAFAESVGGLTALGPAEVSAGGAAKWTGDGDVLRSATRVRVVLTTDTSIQEDAARRLIDAPVRRDVRVLNVPVVR